MSDAVNQEYGKQIWQAYLAIQQLYADCDKLLQDCDGTIGKGRASIFNTVTRDLSKAIGQHQNWMPSALYRFYDARDERPGMVEGITICFKDEDVPLRHDEPLLIVGRIQYSSSPAAEPSPDPTELADDNGQSPAIRSPSRSISFPRSMMNSWELWNAYFAGCTTPRIGEVIALRMPYEDITEINLIVQPLFSIQSIEDVEKMMEQVRRKG